MLAPLFAAAVANNIAWCTEVVGGSVARDAWTAGSRRVACFPDVITVRPGVPAAAVVGDAPRFVKDSFADLALVDYDVLFTASWLGRAAEPRSSTGSWREVDTAGLAGWCDLAGVPELADVPLSSTVLVSGDDAAGAVATVADGVVGLSNVFGGAWDELVAVVGRHFPGLPVVGYEHGADLDAAVAAGFAVLGPLRVWQRR